ncbi:MAG: phosphoglucomutase/phosphomannomutase family protein [Deltaproteobacteria bacterium]|nr:phosphoglucomutase/phosphomannomutase family protein [Candidatus Anaeroferrophillus wilburensis]MBN2888450.1 phosphoglucomutase/phosphomannomutase family protein [Deltaproteobacteria bacterium]
MATTITFGTSGWRAIMNEDFTFANAKICAQAIADYLHREKLADRGIVIGYDSRFMGEDFAAQCAMVMAANQITAHLCLRETPTPVIAWEIISKQRAGGINITASHNPPSYNGIKFSPAWGGPALPETTLWIASRANELMKSGSYRQESLAEAKKTGKLVDCRPETGYLDALRQKIDLETIGRAGLKIAIDPMYGTARGYLDSILKECTTSLEVLHNWRDPYFGGRPPEPSPENIPELMDLVKKGAYDLGLATDGDADRFGIVDAGGEFIDANTFLALAADYLLADRKWEGGLARSVATTHLLDRVARHHQRQLHETAVGFKFIGELITKDALVIGGEESAGLSIKGHVPEKDGILACLLAAEMVAKRGISLAAQRQDLFARIGPLYTRRVNIKLTEEVNRKIRETLTQPVSTVGNLKVEETITIDGTKYLFSDDRWLLIRLSGTEPVARLYAEAPTHEQLDELVREGTAYFFS